MDQVFKVASKSAQSTRLELDARGLVDRGKKIIEKDGFVLIPLTSPPPNQMLEEFSAELLELELPPRSIQTSPIEEIRQRAREILPEIGLSTLPDKWEKLGAALCMKFQDRMTPEEKSALAEIYSDVLGAKVVVEYGDIGGVFREPETNILWGDEKEVVATHLENGIKYRLDVTKLMFSSGNIDERIRMATLKVEGEVVVDMFAGIGYFTLPMAKYGSPKRILAYELNPLAHRYLLENISLNGVEEVVEAHNQDNRECPEDAADRVLMGYVGTTHEFLPKAVRILKKDGGWLHYHETCPVEEIPHRSLERIASAAREREWGVLEIRTHIIKSYAPGIGHLVVDAKLG